MDNEKQGNGLAIVVAFFMGGFVGAILSLLFAPIPGRQTRERIRGASVDAKERTVEAAHKAREATTEAAHKAREATTEAAHKAREATRARVTNMADQSKTRIDEAAGSVKAAVEAGKTAFSEKKAELADVISHDSEEEKVESNEEETV